MKILFAVATLIAVGAMADDMDVMDHPALSDDPGVVRDYYAGEGNAAVEAEMKRREALGITPSKPSIDGLRRSVEELQIRADVQREVERQYHRQEVGVSLEDIKSFRNAQRKYGTWAAVKEHGRRHGWKYLGTALGLGYAYYESQDDGGSSGPKPKATDADAQVAGDNNNIDLDGADSVSVFGNNNSVSNISGE